MRDGWIQTTLGDIAEWFSGGTPKAGDPALYGGPIPWAVIADLGNRLVRSTSSSITQEGLEVIGRRLAPKGSVLVSMYGTIGRVSIAAVPMATNQAIAWGVPNPKWISSEYLYELLRYLSPQLDALGRGATQRNINRKIIRDFPVTLPPLAEQKRIVDLIDAVDTYAQKAATYAERSDQASRWLFRALLAEAEESSETVRLGDLVRLRIGKTPPRNDNRYWTTDLERPFCTIADMQGPVVHPIREGVTELAESTGKAKRFPAGTLLMSFKLTIGRVGFAGTDLFPNEAIVGITPTSNSVDVRYLALWLSAQDLTAGSGRAVKGNTLTQDAIKAIRVELPPLREQKRIVDVVTAATDVADQAARAASAAQALRTSLSTALLTGEHEIPETYDELLEAV